MKKHDSYTQILLILKDLKLEYPQYPISQHISLALSEDEIMGLDDKTFLKCLEKYKAELDLNTVPDTALDKIIEDGNNLFKKEEVDDEWQIGDSYI